MMDAELLEQATIASITKTFLDILTSKILSAKMTPANMSDEQLSATYTDVLSTFRALKSATESLGRYVHVFDSEVRRRLHTPEHWLQKPPGSNRN